jgi:membrane-associated protease RseP (regulator of RpoE activity)
MYIALFVAAIVLIVMFHEFGHYSTAKLFGMKVEQFFFGFGPKIWSFARGETEYGWKAIPAGGYVKISGMNRYEPVADDARGRLFHEKPGWQRLIVLVAGSATHFVLAFVLLFAGLALFPVPRAVTTNVIAAVEPDSPAATAGLQDGDRIVAVEGTATPDFDALLAIVSDSPGETLSLTVDRDGREVVLDATPAEVNPQGERVGFLGIRPEGEVRTTDYGVGEALRQTISGDYSLAYLTRANVAGLGQVFAPQNLAAFFSSVGSDEPRALDDPSPSSLIGAGQIVNRAGQEGQLFSVLVVLASLNVVLGIVNMLPLPPLDGGHVAVLLIEEAVNGVRRLRGVRGTRWQMDPSVITPIALAVLAFFVVLSGAAIINDITRPITESLQQ